MIKERKISAIKEGTVLDHLPKKTAFKVAEILQLADIDNVLSVASNLKSKKQKKKDIIKIGGRYFTKEEVNKIAVIAPNATLSIIKDYKVKEKIKLTIPDEINNIIKCSNPDCITNNEPVETIFYVIKKQPLKIKCHYCERNMDKESCEKNIG